VTDLHKKPEVCWKPAWTAHSSFKYIFRCYSRPPTFVRESTIIASACIPNSWSVAILNVIIKPQEGKVERKQAAQDQDNRYTCAEHGACIFYYHKYTCPRKCWGSRLLKIIKCVSSWSARSVWQARGDWYTGWFPVRGSTLQFQCGSIDRYRYLYQDLRCTAHAVQVYRYT